jgi:hypothetical protein
MLLVVGLAGDCFAGSAIRKNDDAETMFKAIVSTK